MRLCGWFRLHWERRKGPSQGCVHNTALSGAVGTTRESQEASSQKEGSEVYRLISLKQ